MKSWELFREQIPVDVRRLALAMGRQQGDRGGGCGDFCAEVALPDDVSPHPCHRRLRLPIVKAIAMHQPRIITVPILPFGMVHCHVVAGSRGCVLVDTGTPGSAPKIHRTLQKHGFGWGDIKLVIVTHAHADHAGSVAAIQRLTAAPVLAHAGDLAFCERRLSMN